MRTRANVVPRLLVDGDPRHGVVTYARQLDQAITLTLGEDGPPPARPVEPGEPLHVHFTDKLFGSTPLAAADRFADLAARHPVSVTLHDLPQPSDGRHRTARERAYARVVGDARAVVCNSHHELDLLADTLGHDPPTTSGVIPLPLPTTVDDDGRRPTRTLGLEAAVLGFFYPGKGHDDVAEALLEAWRSSAGGARPRLHVLGAASGGHDEDLRRFVADCGARGLGVEVTGYLDEPDLVRHSRLPVVPVVAHQHISASGSLNSWIAAGRRPLVRTSRYTREMAALRPHTVTLYEPGRLAQAICAAADDPGSTWLGQDAVLAPRLPDVAAAYLGWWRETVPW